GRPPDPATGPRETRPRATLVDIWALWCPGCRETAPGLVELHEKYKDRGVAFVSISNMPREGVEAFVKHFGVTWPSAYEVPHETIARWGAFNREIKLRGYEVKLIFYVLGADGRVRWNDHYDRVLHKNRSSLI